VIKTGQAMVGELVLDAYTFGLGPILLPLPTM